MKVFLSEFLGTFWIILAGCGSILLASNTGNVGNAYLNISLAFGFAIITSTYGLNGLSDGHFNPIITLGLLAAQKIKTSEVLTYILAQIWGGLIAALVLFIIVTGNGSNINNFAVTGFDNFSPFGYSLITAFVVEFILGFVLLITILGVSNKNIKSYKGLITGVTFAVIIMLTLPITGGSVNPARSISQAIFVGGTPLIQLWLFCLAPTAGAILAGRVSKFLFENKSE
jgi:aquaporin Z